MDEMREVKLELLRAGPAHNQLLSPLTPYVALCGDSGPVTFHIDMEQAELVNRLERLRYFSQDEKTKRVLEIDNTVREAELEELGRLIGKVLSDMKTLSPELRLHQSAKGKLINLRLVLSGSELSLLPFEMAVCPLGFPGERLPLVLQTSVPLTVTREVRRSQPLEVNWDRPPRILFAYAAPGKTVPAEAHLHAIRLALEPWIRWQLEEDKRKDEVKKLVTVLPNASLPEIREICARDEFTHVHILAHGDYYQKSGGERRYGLALRDPQGENEKEVVGGDRLAQALRATRSDRSATSRPSVVTLMTCDGGNQASVISPGGSIAHELHPAGIPWVFASQFPLTKSGSIRITEALYRALFEGADPRCILRDLRNLLRSGSGKDHDWASLVAYVSLPANFGDELSAFRDHQRRAAIEVSFDRAARSEKPEIHDAAIADVRRRLKEWEKRLPEGDSYREQAVQADYYGLRGAMEKRVALLLYKRDRKREGEEALRTARHYYAKAMNREITNHWTATQYLSLCAVLEKRLDSDRWVLAHYGADKDLKSLNPETQGWAHGTLAELGMLKILRPTPPDVDAIKDEVRRHCLEIVRLMGEQSFAVLSTRWQFERYRDFWVDPRWDPIVKEALEAFGEAPTQAELPHERR